MAYDFNTYMINLNKTKEYIKFHEIVEEQELKILEDTLKKRFEKYLLLQTNIGENRKNEDRKYNMLIDTRFQQHANPEEKNTYCCTL